MIPVEQRTPNDCMRACLASILECDYEIVPEAISGKSDRSTFNQAVTDFLTAHGYSETTFGIWGDELPYLMFGGDRIEYLVSYPGHWIASVKSPRSDGWHAVVMHGHKIVWDPHPERDMGHRGFKQATMILSL